MNSFLSTSVNRQQARSFLLLAEPSNDIEKVFFEIDADPRLENIKSFSNITSLSFYPDEKEVLLMVGSIFQLVDIKRDSDGIWNIRMVLCLGNDHQLQPLFQHMRNELGTGETNLLELGHILQEMEKLDNAEKHYRRYLDQLSDGHSDISRCYHALYSLNKKALIRTLKSDHSNIACIHNNIGEVHQRKGDDTQALESYEKALTIWKKAYGEDHPRVAECLSNIGNIYEEEERYSKALEYHEKALIIRQKHLPTNHSDLGGSHSSIAMVHRCLGHFDEALEYYN